jgi:hypothetical protein
MATAKGHGELVAHLATERLFLGKAHVVRVARPLGAEETGLGRDERKVGLVAEAARRADRQLALVDAAGRGGRFAVGRAEPGGRGADPARRRGLTCRDGVGQFGLGLGERG